MRSQDAIEQQYHEAVDALVEKIEKDPTSSPRLSLAASLMHRYGRNRTSMSKSSAETRSVRRNLSSHSSKTA